ncbi:hypothetical protein H9L39_09945 [Fusarium oxysporum f. sp. albedinis]|nr:hypothetical protein H9L39_09945 [Fusarium oxysporum f. sp. albedinis]
MDSDKLPALGGLATRVSLEFAQQGSASEYLAGMWKHNLFCDLFWLALDHESKRKDPSTYSAPSWSWASVNHPVHYHYHEESENLAILRDAKVNLENDKSPFGKATDGWIHLSAIIIHPCTVDDRYKMFFIEQDSRPCIKVQWDPPKYGLPTSFLMDYANKLSELVAVPLYWVEKSNDPIYNVRGPYYLILTMAETNSRASGDIPRFRRVGAGSPEITRGSDVQLSLVRAMFRRGREQGKLDEIIIE